MNAFVSCEPEQSYLAFSSVRLTGEAYRVGIDWTIGQNVQCPGFGTHAVLT
jgi:hypothetical protein